jgi:mannose-1-phosphate guanylyltransferase
LAADHFIADQKAFQQAVMAGEPLASEGQLVSFGIVPTHAETGYGYIQKGAALRDQGFAVARFVEKPDASAAESYLESGDYYWNSGMFMFKANAYLETLSEFRPDILEACIRAMEAGSLDMDFVRVNAEAFENCPEDSIDYAVMEKACDSAVIPLDAGWSDIGSWSALWEIGDKDQRNNVCKGDVLALDTHNSLIHAEHKLVATLGVDDLVVVETKDAVLVAHKNRVQDVKKIVEALKNDGRHEHMNHREVYRPWGIFDSVDD